MSTEPGALPRTLTHRQRSLLEPSVRRHQAAQAEAAAARDQLARDITLVAGCDGAELNIDTWVLSPPAATEP